MVPFLPNIMVPDFEELKKKLPLPTYFEEIHVNLFSKT